MKVKQWLAGAAAVCIAGICTSCGGGAGTGETTAVTGDAAPLFYYSQGGLYMVRGDEKPRLLTDDVEEPPYVDRNRNFPGVQGFYLLRSDGRELVFCPRYTSLEDKTALYSINTAGGKVKTVCDDLAVFLEGWNNFDLTRYGEDGSLYYIRQNREAVRTDLYAYKNGKSRLVRENVVSFTLGGDQKTILYYSGNEGTGNGFATDSSDRFLDQWYAKYSFSYLSLNRLNTETGECETFSNRANLNDFTIYDPESFSSFTFAEMDEEQHLVRREIGDIPDTASGASSCEVARTISPTVRVVKDTSRNAWVLEVDGHEPYILEMLLLPNMGPELTYESQLRFSQADGALYYFNDSIRDEDVSNFYRLTIEDGKGIEKKNLYMHADSIMEGYKNGVFFSKAVFDRNWISVLSYTDGTNTVTLDDVQGKDLRIWAFEDNAYLSVMQEKSPFRRYIYTFDGAQTALWAENVYGIKAANNRLYYTKEDAAPFSMYQGETLITDQVDGIVSLHEEIF